MSQPVTVTHGGLEVTTNTMSEADLRTEMGAPVAVPAGAPAGASAEAAPADSAPPPEAPAAPAAPAPVRDEKGRFTRAEGEPATPAPPAAEPALPLEPPAPPDEARPKEESPRHHPIARMNQALRQKAEAERRAAALEAELARLRGTPGAPPGPPPTTGAAPPPPRAADGEPQFEQFTGEADPYTAYVQAWARWDNRRQIAETLAAYEQQQAEKIRTTQFETRLAEGRSRLPDFETVLTEADKMGLQVSAVMQAAIVDSPRAADLVYFLAQHPEECTQLAEESVADSGSDAVKWMRRFLESRLAPRAVSPNGTGPAAKATVSTAKPPITPVGSSQVNVSDEKALFAEETTPAQHARLWNRKLNVPGTLK
jgi:hypothetical protein